MALDSGDIMLSLAIEGMMSPVHGVEARGRRRQPQFSPELKMISFEGTMNSCRQ